MVKNRPTNTRVVVDDLEDLVAFPLGLVVHHGAGANAPEDGGHAELLPGIVTLGSGIITESVFWGQRIFFLQK